jgi:hypothetical protein
MSKLCIMYLTDAQRPFAFPKFLENFSKCKYLSQITLLVLTHENNLESYDAQLSKTSIQYRLANVESDKNYLRKIKATLDYMGQYKIPYLMKHDNDILMSSHLYDYLFENLEVLETPSNLVLTPVLTSGIPTCDVFMEDFLSKEEQEILGKLFLQYRHGPLWGTDYTALNQFTVDATEWNAAKYYNGVKSHPHHYKGIHPVRMNKDAIVQLNDYVLKHKDAIFEKKDFKMYSDNTSPYFCNSIYCIKASVYATILNRNDLYVDSYDEVPLNKWRDMFSLNLVIVRNGAAVHPYYNTIDNYLSYEKDFCSRI